MSRESTPVRLEPLTHAKVLPLVQAIRLDWGTFKTSFGRCDTVPELVAWFACRAQQTELDIGGFAMVAREADQTSGMGVLRYLDDTAAEVTVWVAPTSRGRGVGRGLVSAMITRARRRGLLAVQARIHVDNRDSQAFFERQRFTRESLSDTAIGWQTWRWEGGAR